MTKVAFIGAGSVEFTRNVVTDLCGFPELRGQLELMLHDIDAERLGYAEALARRINEQTGAGARVASNTDRQAAVEGADYVINEIQVGGYAATRADFDIPARYGVRQTISDTIGVGGVFRGLRTIPVLMAIGEDLAKLAPDSYLLNYSNPMAMLPWAVYAGTPFDRVAGMCHSVRDTHRFLASLAGVPVSEVDFSTAGFNHQAFVLRFEHNGTDLYPKLRAVIEADPELQRRVRVEIFRRFGYFPTESSEHGAEYVPWFLRHDEEIDHFRIPVGEYLRRSERNLDEYQETREELESGAPLALTPTSELASEFIHAHQTGVAREIYLNVRNDGLISNLPPECCVEVPALVDGSGPHPRSVGALPPQLAALNRTFLNVVELTVRAVLDGDRRHVYQAVLLDPNAAAVLTTRQAVALCDGLFEAHGDLMPAALR
ncbi:alpha-glucosidase/alpha-galactosidase [Amycolatopsis pigmentata]|uniref:Alpha-glucosidase/alpha-galactosidase n=1 Tax=Amycolatopsis pigmentata TaxID=450801 RepID=A0ABW5FMG4_9PSEU